MNRGIIALVFRCKITGGDLAITGETTAYRWADEPDVRQLAEEAYAVRVLGALKTTPLRRSGSTTAPAWSSRTGPSSMARSPVPTASTDTELHNATHDSDVYTSEIA